MAEMEDLVPGDEDTDRCPSCLFPKGVEEDPDRPNASCVDNWAQLCVSYAEAVERLQAALHEHAIHAVPEENVGRYYRCNICLAKAWKEENLEHGDGCPLHGFDPEGEGS